MLQSSLDYWRLPIASLQPTPTVSPRSPNAPARLYDGGYGAVFLEPISQKASLQPLGPDFWKLPLPVLDDCPDYRVDALHDVPVLHPALLTTSEPAGIFEKVLDQSSVIEDDESRQEIAFGTQESPTSRNSDIPYQLEHIIDAWCAFSLPYELVGRAFYYLDCRSLLRSGCACSEWGRLSRAKGRWRCLFRADWGMRNSGSRREYRQWLDRLCSMKMVLSSLRGRGHPGNNFGSAPRRQLYKVLETIVDLCAAENTTATYPSQVLAILRENSGLDLMLALLDDESSRLACLALRCLGDIAGDPLSQPELRSGLQSRSTQMRDFLEGTDIDLAESAARVLLNLLGDAPGTPLCLRRRGPFEFMTNGRQLTPLGLATSWVGVWSGEMRFARSGGRDSTLHFALGFAHDPVVVQVASRLQSISASYSSLPSSSRCAAKCQFPEAGELQRWCHELEREACINEPAGLPMASHPDLIGAGLDAEAGAFTVQVQLPSTVSVANFKETGNPWTQAPAAPAKLYLQYEQRVVKIELVGFLCEGSGSDGTKLSMMYGIWGTVPPRQRHLFVLQRIATLPVPPCS